MSLWSEVNHRLVAKAISELHFEEVLKAIALSNGHYQLTIQKGVTYLFDGRMSAWGHLWVNPHSIKRTDGKEITAGQFFIDTQPETNMSDITLATFLEEMNDTLYSDIKLAQNKILPSDKLALMDGEKVQLYLNGHPKLLLNKGRMGWGSKDLAAFAPESKPVFKLRWILVHKDQLIGAGKFTAPEFSEKQKAYPEHELIPVHPWQWDNIIELQFQSELQNGNIIDLGIGGDDYSPQISIRTLSNITDPKKPDIKLPLSILNTSCVRGLPQKYLTITPMLSKNLIDLCQSDDLLKNVEVLSEEKSLGYTHPFFHQVEGASYRYHEHLGAVWRESAQGKLASNEKAILSAALFYQDESKKTLLASYAEKAGITVSEWMKLYTQKVIIPLYHLQLAYGVGMVSHGQNVVVKLKDFAPAGLFLKDFHGDLRLSTKHTEEHKKFFPEVAATLTHLPPEHLIHDLVTGHFITTLRFLAGALEDSNALTESSFYQVISQEIQKYHQTHSNLVKPETNILAPEFQRVLVNKVRFKIGYGDNAERPLPILGSLLKNPLFVEEV